MLDDIKCILQNLLQNRDFLGSQLSYAQGIISQTTFEIIADEYFKQITKNSDFELLSKAKLLHNLLGKELDSDIISVCLNCDLDQAFRLKQLILKDGES